MEGFFIITSIMFFSSVITKMCFTHRENVIRIRHGLPIIEVKGIKLYLSDWNILSSKKSMLERNKNKAIKGR